MKCFIVVSSGLAALPVSCRTSFLLQAWKSSAGQQLIMLANFSRLRFIFIYAGFSENKWPHSISGPVDSLYLRLSEMNRCIHRDYQSIAVNGARSSNMEDTMHGLARNQAMDYPMIVVLALVGNDVCNGQV